MAAEQHIHLFSISHLALGEKEIQLQPHLFLFIFLFAAWQSLGLYSKALHSREPSECSATQVWAPLLQLLLGINRDESLSTEENNIDTLKSLFSMTTKDNFLKQRTLQVACDVSEQNAPLPTKLPLCSTVISTTSHYLKVNNVA